MNLHQSLSTLVATVIIVSGCVVPDNGHSGNGRQTSGSSDHRGGPAKEEELEHYATIDIADCVVAEHVKRYGPYRIEMRPSIDFFALYTPVFFLRQDPDFDPSRHQSLLELADAVKGAAQRAVTGSEREPDMADLAVVCRDLMATGGNNGNSNFEMSKTSNSNPGLEKYFSMFGFSLSSGSYVNPHYDARSFVPTSASRHSDVFPAHGKGKLLRLQAVHGIYMKSSYPRQPFFHTEWTLYLVGDRKPLPKIQYIAIPAHFDGEFFAGHSNLVSRDPATGGYVLNDGKAILPLFETQFPGTVEADRFDAALVQLLNSMSDADLDSLEEVSW